MSRAEVGRELAAAIVGEVHYTRAELAEHAGIDLDFAIRLWHGMGFPGRARRVAAFT